MGQSDFFQKTKLNEGIVKYRLALFLLFCGGVSTTIKAQSFQLKEPDTAKIYLMVDVWDYQYTSAYIYLKENYRALQEPDSVKREGEEEQWICSFQQNFEKGISYRINGCGEEGGQDEILVFPKIRTEEMRAFVELLFYNESNVWTSMFTYEPDGAGCYYTIEQTDTQTLLKIWCGC